MKHFDNIEKLKNASVEELLEIPELNRLSAEQIHDYFHQK